MKLHSEFGEMTRFRLGPTQYVSVASPKLFREHANLSNRPVELYLMFEPVFGPTSICYANDDDANKRRDLYDINFTHSMITSYYEIVTRAAEKTVSSMVTACDGGHVPLTKYMSGYALTTTVQALFGGFFLNNDSEIEAFGEHYGVVWQEMETTLSGSPAEPGSQRKMDFDKNLECMYDIMRRALSYRRSHPPSSPQDEVLLDTLISSPYSDDVIFADAITYMVAGFHTTGNLLSWCLYYLASHPRVQERVHEEMVAVLGGGTDEITPSDVARLTYCRQVLDETLRCSVLAPYASRYSNDDIVLDGYNIPSKTGIIEALGVVLHDPTIWPDPQEFDPDRFSPQQVKARHQYAFKPFGFAGRRHCPGKNFTYIEAHILLAEILKKYSVDLVPGQHVGMVHGLVTHPDTEIWIDLNPRI